jgi:hypothetical protein
MNGEDRMAIKWTLKYGSAAVLTAIVIIAFSLFANPTMLPKQPEQTEQPKQTKQTFASASFTVMLTDPPTVPAGTTVLNLTYSDILLHVTYPNSTVVWLPVNASGTVNLFSLVNMSQTLASTTIPVGSTVDKLQFTIADVEAMVSGANYKVTVLTDTLVIKIANSRVNQTLSGVLLDFDPTLVQIQATDANGTLVNYYVLVPSATAVIINGLSEAQLRVGTIVKIGENNRVKVVRVVEEFQKNVTIVSASLSVKGNTTTLSVTLKNEGNIAFRVFGLTLQGEFNATRTWERSIWEMYYHHEDEEYEEHGMYVMTLERVHPETIPFKLNGSSLIPLFGTCYEHEFPSLLLQPGENVTVSFSGVIGFHPEMYHMEFPMMVITPIVGDNYTLRLMGEGFETFVVTATP